MASEGIIVIGQGKIARTIAMFPSVVGYVSTEDMRKVLNPADSSFIEEVNPDKHLGVIGIGKTIYKEDRARQWLDFGFKLGVLIHPSAFVDRRTHIGVGSVIWPLAYVDNGSYVGECSTIGPQSGIRDGRVGNYCHLTMQTRVLPDSCLEDFVFLGAGATILERVVVGKGSVISANSTVRKNVPERNFYYEERISKFKDVPKGVFYPLTDTEKMVRECE